MGYSTHYLGHLKISPPLNPAETAWLRSFAEWGGGPRGGDPYEVPDNPRAAWSRWAADEAETTGRDWGAVAPHPTMPYGVRDWVVTPDGRALRWQEQEKSNDAALAIAFLIDHFLAPGAHAQDCGRAVFATFTFDHHLDGCVAAENFGSGELFLLRLAHNVIHHETIVAGASMW